MQVFRSRIVRAFLIVALFSGAAHLSAQATLSKADAARFQAKLSVIEKNAVTPPRKNTSARTTQVTDGEINAYLKYLAGAQVPVGIVEPTLHAAGAGRVTGRATVDLDAVRTQKKRAWTDPLGYLTGRLPVTAAGTLTTANGVGRFTLDSAQISGVTIPKSLLQELLSFYSRTAETPAGINMDEPFKLPAAIREITVGQGTAAIVQ
jgi:phage baseplate assembly protein gpV